MVCQESRRPSPLEGLVKLTLVAIEAKTYYSDIIRIHRLLRWLSGKVSSRSAGDVGSVPGVGRSPGEGNGNPLQYSCLENPMDGGAGQVTYSPWGHKESDATEQQSAHRVRIHSWTIRGKTDSLEECTHGLPCSFSLS